MGPFGRMLNADFTWRMRMKNAVMTSLAVVVLAAGCATTTTITTEKPGAKVFDGAGKELGMTPYTLESKSWLWEATKVTLKQGDKSRDIEIKRGEVDLLPTVGAACLTLTCIGALGGVPLFLAGGLKFAPETKVDMNAPNVAPAK
jgi:hypothetical protein